MITDMHLGSVAPNTLTMPLRLANNEASGKTKKNRWRHGTTGKAHLFNDDNDEVEQLWSEKRMKMINERVEMLISVAERNDDGDTLAWYAPQRYPSSSPHQLMTLRSRRVLTIVVEELRRWKPLRRWCLSKQHLVPRHIYSTTHLHSCFYKFTRISHSLTLSPSPPPSLSLLSVSVSTLLQHHFLTESVQINTANYRGAN